MYPVHASLASVHPLMLEDAMDTTLKGNFSGEGEQDGDIIPQEDKKHYHTEKRTG